MIFFTSAKIFAFTCFRVFLTVHVVLVKYFLEKFLEGKAFDVLDLNVLEFLGYLSVLRYGGKLQIIFNSAHNSAHQNFKFLRHKRLQKCSR
jgi:hypothetical protein